MRVAPPLHIPPRRVLLLGELGRLVLWLVDLQRACRKLGHRTRVFAINGETLAARLHCKWQSRGVSEWMLARFERTLAQFRPDLVVVAGLFGVPVDYMRRLSVHPNRPPVAGLVGDRFQASERERADQCDRLYFTDTCFLRDAELAGFRTPGAYLPLGVDPELFRLGCAARRFELLFVASRTDVRETVVRGLRAPARIVGTDWSALADEGFHRVRNHKIGRWRLIQLYQRHFAVLNVRNEANVEHGLNQRSFEPLACGTPVVNDDLPDVPRCFEPGREILIYRDAEELNEWIARLQRDRPFRLTLAEAGRKRVLAEHTYCHRMHVILKDLNP